MGCLFEGRAYTIPTGLQITYLVTLLRFLDGVVG
jgi:hypothetical protein